MKVFFILLVIATVSYANLEDDYYDFLKILPVEKIREISRRHIETDPEYQVVVSYIHSPTWKALVNEINSKVQIKKLYSFCKSAGLDLNEVIKFIYDLFVGFPPPKNQFGTRSIRQFADEIKAVFPVETFVELYKEKLQNSHDFRMLMLKISSQEANNLVNEVLSMSEVQRLGEKLRNFGIDVSYVIDAIYNFFGWERKFY